jgi:four helix bundle protein
MRSSHGCSEDLRRTQGLAALRAVAPIHKPDNVTSSCHRRSCWQIRRSSRSATDNIAEGFGRYYPKEFHRYVQIARGEINETMNQLHRGLKDGCLTPEEYEKGMELALHAVKTTAGLQRYLNSCIPDNKKPRRP